MYESQHFDLQENAGGFGDPNSWLSGDPGLSPTHRRNHQAIAGAGARNVDRDLFKDLVEIVPLVQSLIVSSLSLSLSLCSIFGGFCWMNYFRDL